MVGVAEIEWTEFATSGGTRFYIRVLIKLQIQEGVFMNICDKLCYLCYAYANYIT